MHLGFASLETGLTQSKNTVNILFKNVSIISIGILTYALCGFNLMYPGEFNGYFGFAGFVRCPELSLSRSWGVVAQSCHVVWPVM